jgi:hypothetical protein
LDFFSLTSNFRTGAAIAITHVSVRRRGRLPPQRRQSLACAAETRSKDIKDRSDAKDSKDTKEELRSPPPG